MLSNVDIELNVGSAILFAVICGFIAHSRGRNVVAWVLLGLVIQCFALILVLVLPNLNDEQDRERRHRLETRRLREQLRTERQISDQRHQHIEHRLGQHDGALGMDTSKPPELTEQTLARLTGSAGDVWFYARDNQRQGPVSLETLRHLYDADVIGPDSLLWTEGMDDWDTLDNVDPFRGESA